MKTENKRLLDAFEYLDAKYVDELFDVLDTPPRRYSQQSKKSSFRYYAALAACLVLLAAAFPVLTNIISNIDFIPGWAESSEATETPETTNGMYDEYILTEEDLAQINEAYFKFNFLADVDYDSKSEEYWNEIRNSKYGKYAETPEAAMSRIPKGDFYFGKYSECFVFSVQGLTGRRRDYNIAGYKFYSIPPVWVIHDSTTYYFDQAYNNGYLTDSDIGRIYDMYIEYFRDGVYPEETTVYEETTEVIHETVINPDYLKFVSDLEPISEEMMLEIRTAWPEYQWNYWFDRYYTAISGSAMQYTEAEARTIAEQYADDFTRNTEYIWFVLSVYNDKGDISYKYRYYGMIGEYAVLVEYQNTTFNYSDEILYKKIGDHTFYFRAGGEIYLYKDGVFVTMKEVYDQGLISDDDVSKIANRHVSYEAFFEKWRKDAYYQYFAELTE